jgi:cell division protein FtsB
MRAPLVRFVSVLTLLVIVGYAVVTLRGPRGIAAYFEKQRQIHQLEKRNAAMAQEIERKRERLDRLAKDPAEQELEIRERLKLVHPKDKVFILEPQTK